VARQPQTEAELVAATRALLSCPTSSIGARGLKPNLNVFPEELEVGSRVYLTGFNSERAYGGNAWFIQRPWGNVLIDGPRFTGHLVKKFREWGGVSHVMLTHRDDLGDAEQYAREFSAKVFIHEADARAAPFATDFFTGAEITSLNQAFQILPVPGHTRGSVMFLLERRWLFTGDSLFWSRELDTLHAHRRQCWFSWPKQVESLSTLRGLDFEWVLPGHGGRAFRTAEVMQSRLEGLLRRMVEPGWRDAW
jgi:glyoxylase-like metal-dependent hydrolase (beta-lactamase superfamily II)